MTEKIPSSPGKSHKPIWTRWWMIVIYVIVGLGVIANVGGDSDDDPGDTVDAAATPTSEAAATTQPDVATTTETPTTTLPVTTTTVATTTTEPLNIITSGTYIVGDEIAPGVYRFAGYMARLDDSLGIIDNGLVDGDHGLGLVIITETDSYAEVSGEAILVEDFGTPIDPVANGFTDGSYLVGYDVQPGRYRITPDVGGTAYWARLNDTMDIIDNNLSDGQLIVIVQESDWALEISGSLEPLP